MLVAFIVVLMISITAISETAVRQHGKTSNTITRYNADQAAEAGIERSILELNSSSSFTGYSEQDFYNDPAIGRARYSTTVVDANGSNAKYITATGKIFKYDQSTNPTSVRKVRVTVVGTQSTGYSVKSGPGGLILGGSANIINSDVHIGGYLRLTGGSKIGSENGPVNVNVANKRCPSGASPGATYPTVCSGNPPIQIDDHSSVAILGTTCATGQTQAKFPDTANNRKQPQIRPASSGGSGLLPNCTAPPVDPITYNKTPQVSSVAVTSSATDNTQHACTGWRSGSEWSRSWPANLRLNGNVSLGGSCDITLNGDVYITGNLTMGGGAKFRVANSVGTTRPVVLVDGTITIGGGSSIVTNSVGTSVEFVSLRSNASCNPNCTSLSGNDLYNSQNVTTVNVSGGVNMPGSAFQATWGKLVLAGGGSIGEASGQTIDMSGAGSITFGTGLNSGAKTWKITSYQRVY